MSIIQGNSKTSAGGYTIDQSIRFNNDDTAYMTRTPASAGNRKLWTLSLWFKRCSISETQVLFAAATSGINEIRFSSTSNTIYYDWSSAGVYPETTAVLRDTSAWYHLVTVYDTDNATAADRLQCYLNGTRLTLSATLSSGTLSAINNNVVHAIGISSYSIPNYYPWDGYVAEVNFIDGQALAPTSFGETNSTTGQWVPIAYTGSYGSNGFYITGENSASLGTDYSGNGNNFTSSGLTSADQMLDTPTDNFWTLNPLDSGSTLANGNLQNKGGNSTNTHAPAFPTTGKWYVEIDCIDINTGTAGAHFFGICDASVSFSQNFSDHATISAGQQRGGQLSKNNSNTTTGTAVNDGDIIALAFDADNLTLDLYVNNVQSGSQITGLTDVQYKLWIQDGSTVTNMQVNFGQTGGFTYTPPTGFNALSTANLSDPTIADPTDHFQTVLDTGANIKTTAEALYTDQFEWIKDRANANNHQLIDSVRGTSAVLQSNTTAAETTYSAPSGNSVGWVWKANGTGSSNTDGTITSTVSADATSGFSIIRWSGTAANGTIGHGLGIQPSLYIVKNTATTNSWMVGSTLYSNTQFLILNASDALDTSAAIWNSAYPTSSVINLGSNVASNGSGTNNMICYAFAEVEGFSKIGSYTGNSSTNGPFIYTGFKPALVILKVSSNSPTGWIILDNKRDTFNSVNHVLQPNSSDAEASGSDNWDFNSNGFKVRTTWAAANGSGYTVIYMAFAESPFKTANAR